MPFLVQSSWNLGTQLKLISAASGLALYSCGTDHAINRVLPLRGADHTDNTSRVIATQLVHWRADCCPSVHWNTASTVARVYGAVAWQCVEQFRYNTYILATRQGGYNLLAYREINWLPKSSLEKAVRPTWSTQSHGIHRLKLRAH
jgi:hypothetical protein